ncbi:hypothetical protein I552_9990 [Mycobacterium xenopi 3993]|nr:hypothetical protein I552_9990 [Mycobacterium xenopi 3993]
MTSKRNTDHERSALANRAPVPTGPTQLVTAAAVRAWPAAESISGSRGAQSRRQRPFDVRAHRCR